MRSYRFFAALLFALCFALFCLCSCSRTVKAKKTIKPEILRLIQETKSELTECSERCRSKAEEYPDRKDYLLALANSQKILADYHERVIDALQKQYKFERISTFSTTSEMDPWLLVLAPPEEYVRILAEANPEAAVPEILNILEFTNENLRSDKEIEAKMNRDQESEEPVSPVFHLCTLCGRLSTGEPEENCPLCHSGKDRIVQLENGEIPIRKKDYDFVGE